MMATRFEKCRFHIDFGPAELFARVHQKMDCVSSVSLHGKHFKTRLDERQIPAEVIADVKNFRITGKTWQRKNLSAVHAPFGKHQ